MVGVRFGEWWYFNVLVDCVCFILFNRGIMGLIWVLIEGLLICVIDKYIIFDYIYYIIIKYCFLLLEFCSKKNKMFYYWF